MPPYRRFPRRQKLLTISCIVGIAFLYLNHSNKNTDGAVYQEPASPLTSSAQELSSSPQSSDDSLTPLSPAYAESLSFFDDIEPDTWALMKRKVQKIAVDNVPSDSNEGGNKLPFGEFYHTFYHPDFACQNERRIGRKGDGGKWVCDPHRITAQETCLVYSVGSNNDFSFERAVHKNIGQHCEIHTFDFSNYTRGAIENNVKYHMWGISDKAFTINQRGRREFKTLQDTVVELGHVGKTIDIFKIDCEGCEWETHPSWFDEKVNVSLKQVLLEIHSDNKSSADVEETKKLFSLMRDNGYVTFHKEANIQFWRPAMTGKAIEYAFLKLDRTFF